jgi:hypothetical protein
VHRLTALAAGVLAVSLVALPALAVSVTNRDERDHKVTVIEGESSTDHALKPSAVLEGVCASGCVIRLDDSQTDEYELEGDEVLTIEDGELYYDGPEVPDPGTGGGGQPPGPKQ